MNSRILSPLARLFTARASNAVEPLHLPLRTRLMMEHVEKCGCPSTTSAAILGGTPLHFIGETAR